MDVNGSIGIPITMMRHMDFLPHITVLAQMLWMRVIMDMKHMRRI